MQNLRNENKEKFSWSRCSSACELVPFVEQLHRYQYSLRAACDHSESHLANGASQLTPPSGSAVNGCPYCAYDSLVVQRHSEGLAPFLHDAQ